MFAKQLEWCFENNVQFIPDSTNFNKAAFGLPTVNFYPILRDKVTADTIVPSGTSHAHKYTQKNSRTIYSRLR